MARLYLPRREYERFRLDNVLGAAQADYHQAIAETAASPDLLARVRREYDEAVGADLSSPDLLTRIQQDYQSAVDRMDAEYGQMFGGDQNQGVASAAGDVGLSTEPSEFVESSDPVQRALDLLRGEQSESARIAGPTGAEYTNLDEAQRLSAGLPTLPNLGIGDTLQRAAGVATAGALGLHKGIGQAAEFLARSPLDVKPTAGVITETPLFPNPVETGEQASGGKLQEGMRSAADILSATSQADIDVARVYTEPIVSALVGGLRTAGVTITPEIEQDIREYAPNWLSPANLAFAAGTGGAGPAAKVLTSSKVGTLLAERMVGLGFSQEVAQRAATAALSRGLSNVVAAMVREAGPMTGLAWGGSVAGMETARALGGDEAARAVGQIGGAIGATTLPGVARVAARGATEAVQPGGILGGRQRGEVNLEAVESPQATRMYHGTSSAVETLDPTRAGTGRDAGLFGRGMYMAEEQGAAQRYGPRLFEMDPPQHPYRWPEGAGNVRTESLGTKPLPEQVRAEVLALYQERVPRTFDSVDGQLHEPTLAQAITEVLQRKGYDGVIYQNPYAQRRQIEAVVFDAGRLNQAGGQPLFVAPETVTTLGGAAVGAAAPAEDEQERQLNILSGAAIGATALPAAARATGKAAARAVQPEGILGGRQRGELNLGVGQEPAPTFYSQLQRTIEQKMPNRASAEQIKGILRGSPVKQDELVWTGFDDFLASRPSGPITKQEALDFLRQNEVRVEEVVKGGPEYKQYLIAKKNLDYLHEDLKDHGYYASEQTNGAWAISRASDWRIVPLYRLNPRAQQLVQQIIQETGQLPAAVTPARYDKRQYQLPGVQEDSYRELVLTLPPPEVQPRNLEWRRGRFGWAWFDGKRQVSGAYPDAGEMEAARASIGVDRDSSVFSSPHWDEPNVLAHVRFNDRVDADGKRVLFIEEVQSDWAQAGRKEGFRGQPTREAMSANDAEWNASRQPPLMPFSTTEAWATLALRRMVRWAAENGYDRVAWTTGAQQAERYDLSKHISELHYSGTSLTAYDHNGQAVIQRTGVRHEDLPDLIGKEAAEKLLAQPPQGTLRSLVGLDLKVGGEGMLGFYDRILPIVANKLGKRFGARVRNITIQSTSPEEMSALRELRRGDPSFQGDEHLVHVPALDITPAMRQSVVYEGQPLFVASETVTTLGGAAVGAAAPAEDEQERQRNILAGMGIGAGVGVGARRLAKNPYGRQRGQLDMGGTAEPARPSFQVVRIGRDWAVVRQQLGEPMEITARAGSQAEALAEAQRQQRLSTSAPVPPGGAGRGGGALPPGAGPPVPPGGAGRGGRALPPGAGLPVPPGGAGRGGGAPTPPHPDVPRPGPGGPGGPGGAGANDQGAEAVRKAGNMLGATPPTPDQGSLWNRVVRAWTNRYEAADRYQEAVVGRTGLRVVPDDLDASARIRLMVGADLAAEVRVQQGLRPALEGLSDDDAGQLSIALILGNNIETAGVLSNEARRFSAGLSAEDSRAGLQWLADNLPADQWQRIQDRAAQVYDFVDTLRDRMRQAGLISEDTLGEWREQYAHWVPTRILDYQDDLTIPVGTRLSLSDSGVRHYTMEGTERFREDPLGSLYDLAFQVEARARKNEAVNALVGLDELLPEGQRVFAATQRPATNADIVVQRVRDGEVERFLVPNTLAAVINGPQITQAPGFVRAYTSFTRAVSTVFSPTFALIRNPAIDIPEYLTRELIRSGGNPLLLPQITADLLRGYAEAFKGLRKGEFHGDMAKILLGGGGQAGMVKRTVRSRRESVRRLREGGGIEVHSAKDVQRILRDLLEIREGGPLRVVKAVAERTEYGPRIAAMNREERRLAARRLPTAEPSPNVVPPAAPLPPLGRASGPPALPPPGGPLALLPPAESAAVARQSLPRQSLPRQSPPTVDERSTVREGPTVRAGATFPNRPPQQPQPTAGTPVRAILAGRTITIDFNEGGTLAKTINQFVPFFNVGVQATAQVGRAFRENPAAFATTTLGLVAAPAIGAEAWNRADSQRSRDYDDVPQYLKDQGVVIMLPGEAPLDSQGNRKPQFWWINMRGWAPFAVMARQATATALPNATPQDWGGLMASIGGGMLPVRANTLGDVGSASMVSLLPGGSTALQLGVNKGEGYDFFRGRRIATRRGDEMATNASRAIAQALTGFAQAIRPDLQVRPSQVEFAVRDVFGGLGALALDISGRPGGGGNVPQYTPVAGSALSALGVRSDTGEQLRQAREHLLPPEMVKALRDAGVDYSPAPARGEIRKGRLTQTEEAEYQRLTNEAVEEEVGKLLDGPAWDFYEPDQREKRLRQAVDRARERATREMRKQIGFELQQRAEEARLAR